LHSRAVTSRPTVFCSILLVPFRHKLRGWYDQMGTYSVAFR